MDKIERIKQLVRELNKYRDEYYNHSNSSVSDQEYDKLFDELVGLEKETGVYMSNSPTQSVGYEVKSELAKIKHNHPMLSLDKTKSVTDIVKFFENHDGIAMLKMDGLTCSLGYNNELNSAETRGNGEIGEDVLHNAKVVTNIPLRVNCDGLIVDGEMIIDYPTFEKINKPLPIDKRYSTPRNLASGSIRQLDSEIAKERGLRFIAWKLVQGIDENDFCTRLFKLNKLGFEVVPYLKVKKGSSEEEIQDIINTLVKDAEGRGFPIDGIVFSYSDVAYGESLGMTARFPRHSIAFKFKDDVYETTLKEIQWQVGKSGILTPVAIFEPVEIDGTMVSRSTVHNVSILTELDLRPGDIITVYKSNMIIPAIYKNLSEPYHISSYLELPAHCPICGAPTEVRRDSDTAVLVCTNDDCQGKLLGKLCHAVSKNALDIVGLSESTLEFLIEQDWVNSLRDLFQLEPYKVEWMHSPGFGKASVMRIFEQLEEKRNTTFERFLYAQSIPMVGRTASKQISKFCHGDIEEFCKIMSNDEAHMFLMIDGFGKAMYQSLLNWYDKHWIEFLGLKQEFEFINEQTIQNKSNKKDLSGITFCITGKLEHFSNRDALVADIEAHGGKYVSSVTAKTNYLINNDVNSTSGKNKKAKEVGCKIISEADYLNMIGE